MRRPIPTFFYHASLFETNACCIETFKLNNGSHNAWQPCGQWGKNDNCQYDQGNHQGKGDSSAIDVSHGCVRWCDTLHDK
jgi:hypothetical protein